MVNQNGNSLNRPPTSTAWGHGSKWLLIGGALLMLYGGLMLAAALLTDFGPDAHHVLKICAVVLPVLTVAGGLLGVLAVTRHSIALAELSRFWGVRPAVLAAVMQSAVMLAAPEQIAPLYASLNRFLPFTGLVTQDPASAAYVFMPMIFALCIHIFVTGLEVMEYGCWHAEVIVRSVTRLLFILIGPSIVRDMDLGYPIMTTALFITVMALAVQLIRNRAETYDGVLKCLGVTVLAAVAFIALTIGFHLLGGVFKWICGLWIGIPVILTGLCVLLLGPLGEADFAQSAEIAKRGDGIRRVFGGSGASHYTGGESSGLNSNTEALRSVRTEFEKNMEKTRKHEKELAEERNKREEQLRKEAAKRAEDDRRRQQAYREGRNPNLPS